MAPPRSRAPIMRGPRAPRNRFTHPDAVAISRRLMRSVIGGLLVALLVAEPAPAGSILYATAASQQRIDGFCLGADGALAATPAVQIATLGRLPRRVLVGNGVLYVAEADRIEAFGIGEHGGLRRLAGSEPVKSFNPQDLTHNPTGSRSTSRIWASSRPSRSTPKAGSPSASPAASRARPPTTSSTRRRPASSST